MIGNELFKKDADLMLACTNLQTIAILYQV